jgi:hypothetical protein
MARYRRTLYKLFKTEKPEFLRIAFFPKNPGGVALATLLLKLCHVVVG